MFYVKTDTGEIVTMDYIRQQHPLTSFTTNGPDDDFLASNGMAKLGPDPAPEILAGQSVQSTNQAELVEGVWTRIVNVIGEEEPAFPSETVVLDQETGQPVRIIVKNGQVFVGGMEDDETPA